MTTGRLGKRRRTSLASSSPLMPGRPRSVSSRSNAPPRGQRARAPARRCPRRTRSSQAAPSMSVVDMRRTTSSSTTSTRRCAGRRLGPGPRWAGRCLGRRSTMAGALPGPPAAAPPAPRRDRAWRSGVVGAVVVRDQITRIARRQQHGDAGPQALRQRAPARWPIIDPGMTTSVNSRSKA